VDFLSTLPRSVLRKRTSAEKPTGVAELKSVGGASRRGSSVHPTSAHAAKTNVQRKALTRLCRSTVFRVLTIFHTSWVFRDEFNARPRQRPPLEPPSARARWKRMR
jgi:hypothetical protein